MKKLYYTIILIIGTLYACNDPYAGNSFIKDESALPAASFMEQSDSLNVSLWVDLLKYTNLFNSLNLSASYTCFVPDNNAMQAYLATKGVAKVTDLKLEDAKIIVKYHTIKGKMYSAVSFENGVLPDSTATGDYLSSIFNENDGKIYVNAEGAIKRTLSTPNAYIHILTKVLTPVTETVWEKINNSSFSIFKEAIEKTGYKNRLNTISEVINDVTYKYKYTLFAVSDSVFKANNINSFSALVDSLKADAEFTSEANKLNQYVGYHLLNQVASYSTLSAFTTTEKSTNYSTMAESQLLNVSEVDRLLYLNYNTITKTGVKLLATNKNCKNGVVHLVNGVMPVKSQKSTTQSWEFTDYSLLSSVLSKYRTSGLTSDYVASIFDKTIFNCYTWNTVPEGRIGLGYIISNKNNTEAYKAINYDYLGLSLGQYGWVEMTTSTIVAGKYTVKLGHLNLSSLVQRGKLMFIVDGNYFGIQIATSGASASKDQYLTTTLGTIEFTTSAKHKIRILATDGYTSYLDCLVFTPL